MARLEIHPADPKGLDRLEADSLVLPMFERFAQPRGVLGALDWRLSGRVARLVRSRTVSGQSGETTLIPTGAWTGPQRAFLFGLGRLRPMNAIDWAREVGRMLEVCVGAGAKHIAYAPPYVADPAPTQTPEQLARGFLSAPVWVSASAVEVVTLLDADGALEQDREALIALGRKSGFQC